MTDSGILGWGVAVEVPDNEAPYFVTTNPQPAAAEVWCGVVSWSIRNIRPLLIHYHQPSNEVSGEHKVSPVCHVEEHPTTY